MNDRAYREGTCDGIMGRGYVNPYPMGNFIRRCSYLAGYMHGQSLMSGGCMTYGQAIKNIETIAKLKRAFDEMLEKASLTPEFKNLWVSARDFTDCKRGIAEQLDEMTWEGRHEAERAIEEHDMRESRQQYFQESTHYAGAL